MIECSVMKQPEGREAALLELWRRSTSPDERQELLARILEPHLDRVARWASHLRSRPDEAADLAQEALAVVCNRVDSFRGESRFSTWLYAVLRNQAQKQWEKGARRERLLQEHVADRTAEAQNPERDMVRRVRAAECRRLIASELTPLEARVFMLHFAADVPLDEIGRQLGLTNRSGARAYLVSAKRKLQKSIQRRARRASGRVARLAPAGESENVVEFDND